MADKRKHIGAKVSADYFQIVAEFCEKNNISKSELVLDGIDVMMGRDARVYERCLALGEEVADRNDKIEALMNRGFFARLFNKGV